MIFLKQHTRGIILSVYIQPRASKNSVAGIHDDALKIKITAPPIDGAANKMCLNFLSKWLGLPKSTMEIISGQKSRRKEILLRYSKKAQNETDMKRLFESI